MQSTKKHGNIYIYGKHALVEALLGAPETVQKVFLAPDLQEPELFDLLEKNNIRFNELKRGEGKGSSANMVGDEAVHQGVIASIDPEALVVDFEIFLEKLKPDRKTALVLLDELTDPHNVGAVIRSAAAFGAAGVLIPSFNQAGITGAVVKTSAGMVFRIPLVGIGNVNRTLGVLKKQGFWIYGLSSDGANDLTKEKFDAPSIFIVGNEGRGIREKTLEHCDIRLRIPIDKKCESLNVAVSAAVVLYQWKVSQKLNHDNNA